MAQPSNPKWRDFLQERIQKDGSWAKAKSEKQLDNLDPTNSTTTETMKLEVAASGGDAAMLVALNEGEVKFVHNITLAKTQEGFVLVGVTGLGHLATFLTITGYSFSGRAWRIRIPKGSQLQEGSQANNVLEFLAMVVTAWIMCDESQEGAYDCLLSHQENKL